MMNTKASIFFLTLGILGGLGFSIHYNKDHNPAPPPKTISYQVHLVLGYDCTLTQDLVPGMDESSEKEYVKSWVLSNAVGITDLMNNMDPLHSWLKANHIHSHFVCTDDGWAKVTLDLPGEEK